MSVLNQIFNKVIVINLERCPDRLAHMDDQLRGVEYEVFRAIDGKEIQEQELIENGVFDKERAISRINRPLYHGELGCVLSHRSIYERMVKEKDSCYLILEDDIVLHRDQIEAFLSKVFNELPEDWDLIYLGCQQVNRAPLIKDHLRLARNHDGTFGYAISFDGAVKILAHNTPFYRNADGILNDACAGRDFNAFVSNPVLLDFTNKFESAVWS